MKAILKKWERVLPVVGISLFRFGTLLSRGQVFKVKVIVEDLEAIKS